MDHPVVSGRCADIECGSTGAHLGNGDPARSRSAGAERSHIDFGRGRIHLHALPAHIISIEPAYRGYRYFTTEEEIVIVEPRSQRIVSTIPKDVSKARAQASGTSTSMAGRAEAPCRIMRRDADGKLTELTPPSRATMGSGSSERKSIAVVVQMPDGQSTAPIALSAPAGQIVVASENRTDCEVTIEPER